MQSHKQIHNHKEKHCTKTNCHMNPKECCKSWSQFLSQNTENECTIKLNAFSRVQPSAKIQPLHYKIHEIYTFSHSCTKGLSSTIFFEIESVTLNLGRIYENRC